MFSLVGIFGGQYENIFILGVFGSYMNHQVSVNGSASAKTTHYPLTAFCLSEDGRLARSPFICS
jgi:hypothetical protein